jgi:hypothetical protein
LLYCRSAALRKADGGPLDNNPIDSFSMDRHRNDKSGATTYWVRGGELLNVWIARYEPDSAAFEQKEGDWFPVGREEILREVGEAFEGSASREDLLALAGAIVGPTKWGLYDRDALETWVQGTKTRETTHSRKGRRKFATTAVYHLIGPAGRDFEAFWDAPSRRARPPAVT